MLWGTGSAKFERSGSTVLLEYSNIIPNWCVNNVNRSVSVYDHYTTHDNVGSYSDFWVDVQLYQYSFPTVKFSEIYPTYLFSHVYFWPHADGYAISGSDGKPTVFFIRNIQHKYVSDTDATRDILSIHFVSTDYSTLTGSLGSQAAGAEGGGF